MIKKITDSNLARDFLNSVPFDAYVPEGFPVCNDDTIILGWYAPDLVCCFPCLKHKEFLEIHCACLKEYRGAPAIVAAQHAFKWIFDNTHYETIRAKTYRKHVARFAILCGATKNNGWHEVRKWVVS